MANTRSRIKDLEPLRITCTSADCGNNLHCFKKSRKMAEVERGKCRYCGADLIEWGRVRERNIKDHEFVFASLKNELVRHHFWHKPIDKKAENHARRKGKVGIKEAARKRLLSSIGRVGNPYDGIQTPYDGNIIFYAQHALACCCRTCLDYWHGIPKNQPLTDNDIDYLVELITLYINERMPYLTEEGEKVPPLR
jgi:hypothetical protein